MIYLSENDGYLKFNSPTSPTFEPIYPKAGRLVIFDQSLVHEALQNTQDKYYIRSEIMYKRSKPLETKTDIEAMNLYNKAISSYTLNPTESIYLESLAFQKSPLLESIVYRI